jgi:hypothetical protein
VHDDEVRDERVWLATAEVSDPAAGHNAAVWEHPAGSQGCSRRTLGPFDARRLNPVLNDEAGLNFSRR